MVSIHAPRTGRDLSMSWASSTTSSFNPRAPHGARRVTPFQHPHTCKFQSTRPARGATSTGDCRTCPSAFQSTRPARGATSQSGFQIMTLNSFNPRAPHGARPACQCHRDQTVSFQSTRPARGATMRTTSRLWRSRMFQSTRPARGATGAMVAILACLVFQSTRPARGATSGPVAIE